MKQCSKCLEFKVEIMFGNRSWVNDDGTKTFAKKSHCRICTNKGNLSRYHTRNSTKEAHRKAAHRYIIKSYGLTQSGYDQMLLEQNGVCAICMKECDRRLSVDHDHMTGKVRALLCNNCNTALGHAKDDTPILKKMIEYLDYHNGSMGL